LEKTFINVGANQPTAAVASIARARIRTDSVGARSVLVTRILSALVDISTGEAVASKAVETRTVK